MDNIGLILAILSIILAILGFLSLNLIRIWRLLSRKILWRNFFANLTDKNILYQLKYDGNKPDVIIGLNSGIVPAAILAFNYSISDLRFLNMMPEYNADRTRTHAKPTGLENLEIDNKYVLIVDDQYYTGYSMRAAYDLVRSLPGGETAIVRRFAVHAYEIPTHKIELDVYNKERFPGQLAHAPWTFSEEIERHYKDRNKR